MYINSKKHFFSIWNKLKRKVTWYLRRINLHGFRYVADANVSIFVRLFFAVISGCSLALGIYLTVLEIFEYYDTFIITRVVTTNYPVWQLRFPAVTVCNYNIVYKGNINKIKDVVMSDKTVERDLFNDFIDNLPLLIYSTLDKNITKDYTKIYGILDRNGYNLDKVMQQLAHPCNSMVKECVWQGEEIPCQYIIHSVKTTQGYCCSFNYYGTENAVKKIIDPYNVQFTYSTLSNPIFGLRLLLDVEKDQYVSTIKPFHGLNVLVHDGSDYPDMHLSSSTLQMSEELKISVTPNIFTSTRDLRDINPKRRGCLFKDELPLEWSSIYSYKTCVSQCKAKATYKFCNCYPFFYPLKKFKRICTLLDVPCLRRNAYNYTAVIVDESNFTEAQITDPYFGEFFHNCTCYPQCDEKIFYVHPSKAQITLSKKNSWYINQNLSVLNVYYSDVHCIKIERDVYFTWDRILAAIGGIFSLCLGGSIISIVECFYFIVNLIVTNSEVKTSKETNLHRDMTNNKVINELLKQKKKNKKKQTQTKRFIKAFENQ